MGKVILTLTNGFGQKSTASFKCKDATRAKELADRRPNCTSYKYYNDGERIPRPIKTKVEKSFEEQVEELAKKAGMSIDAKDVR